MRIIAGLLCVLLLGLLTVLQPLNAQAGQAVACAVPELADHPGYDQLVCEGVAATAAGNYAEAVASFEAAMEIRLFEFPNFELYSRLSLAYWRAGRADEARTTLEKARISLNLFIGIGRCEETDVGFRFVDQFGLEITGAIADEVKRRMCGAIYEPYYGTTLDTIVRDAELVAIYRQALEQVGAAGSGR